jgi:ABC-type glutathione transport system ATPase component
MDSLVIEIHGLTVRYDPKTAASAFAIKEVGLRIGAGEVVGVLGESGSGKSTLAAAIMRLLPSTAECHGQILFENRDLMAMGLDELQRIRGKYISLIPQDPATSLNPVIRIGTQISEVLRAHLQLNHSEQKKRVQELLQEIGFRWSGTDRFFLSAPTERRPTTAGRDCTGECVPSRASNCRRSDQQA